MGDVMAKGSLGVWSSGLFVALTVVYLVLLSSMMLRGLPFPPSGGYVNVFHVLVLLAPAVAIPLWCAVHLAAPPGKQAFTLASLAFVVMWAIVVIINRFVALTMVRHGAGTPGLEWFTPYGSPSLMFTFEMLGWGLFFSIACLLMVPVFTAGRRERFIAGAFGVTGVFSLGAAVGFAVDSVDVIGLVAPIAWGAGPLVWAVLLIAWLRRPVPAVPGR
jgi:hypothetical protein